MDELRLPSAAQFLPVWTEYIKAKGAPGPCDVIEKWPLSSSLQVTTHNWYNKDAGEQRFVVSCKGYITIDYPGTDGTRLIAEFTRYDMNENEWCYRDAPSTGKPQQPENFYKYLLALICLVWLLFHNAEIIEIEPKTRFTKERVKTPGKQAKTRTIKLVTRRYEVKPTALPVPTRAITCERWGVRGHWRTYRSGKRVWIAPYEKGHGSKRKDTVYVT